MKALVRARPHVFAVVQLPPKVTGLTAMNEAMVSVLDQADVLAGVASTSPRPDASRPVALAGRMLSTLAAIKGLAAARRRGASTLYMSCDGGIGLALNLLVVLAARLLRMRVWLHHHSFAYINRRSALMNTLIAFSPRATVHIALCDDMLDGLRLRYAASWRQRGTEGVVLSNAFAIPAASQPSASRADGPLVLGHLSNLTVEKGALRVAALFQEALAAGHDVRLIVAGPTDDRRIETRLRDLIARYPDRVEWPGPVRGEAKAVVLSRIDAFLFPTSYVNEAQPLVLLEALAAGAAVVATGRGCIACDLRHVPGLIADDADFETAALSWVSEASTTSRPDREACREAFSALKRQSDSQLADLVSRI